MTDSVTFDFGARIQWDSSNPGNLDLTNLSKAPQFSKPKVAVLNQCDFTPGIEADVELELSNVTGPELDGQVGPDITITPGAKAPDPWLDAGLQTGRTGWLEHRSALRFKVRGLSWADSLL